MLPLPQKHNKQKKKNNIEWQNIFDQRFNICQIFFNQTLRERKKGLSL